MQMTYHCLTGYKKAFEMLLPLNPIPEKRSFMMTRMIVMIFLLIPEKVQMIPTIISCMHPNFVLAYIIVFCIYEFVLLLHSSCFIFFSLY